jgi:hypothetical protein
MNDMLVSRNVHRIFARDGFLQEEPLPRDTAAKFSDVEWSLQVRINEPIELPVMSECRHLCGITGPDWGLR